MMAAIRKRGTSIGPGYTVETIRVHVSAVGLRKCFKETTRRSLVRVRVESVKIISLMIPVFCIHHVSPDGKSAGRDDERHKEPRQYSAASCGVFLLRDLDRAQEIRM